MHNNAMPPHSHGLQNHAFTGIGQLHSNGPVGFHNTHGLNGNSLVESKEGSGEFYHFSYFLTFDIYF